MARFVEPLCFMFSIYNWEPMNLVGFYKMLVAYRDLPPFDATTLCGVTTSFCVAYRAWTFYDKVSIPNPLSWLQSSMMLDVWHFYFGQILRMKPTLLHC